MSESKWQDIGTAPKDGRPLRFRRHDGSEFEGRWGPYWCGSDCPCDVATEGEAPHDSEPECWCAYPKGYRTGEMRNPTHWQSAPPTQEAETK